jgi:hypothetical protein
VSPGNSHRYHSSTVYDRDGVSQLVECTFSFFLGPQLAQSLEDKNCLFSKIERRGIRSGERRGNEKYKEHRFRQLRGDHRHEPAVHPITFQLPFPVIHRAVEAFFYFVQQRDANHYPIFYTNSYRNGFSRRTVRKKDKNPGGTTCIKVVKTYRGVATQMMPVNTKYGRNCKCRKGHILYLVLTLFLNVFSCVRITGTPLNQERLYE